MSILATSAIFIVLLVSSWTDIRYRRIPNRLTYTAIALAVCTAGFSDCVLWQITGTEQANLSTTLRSAIGLTGCFSILGVLYAAGGIGGGDVKLGAFLGAATGFQSGMSILFLGHLLAGFFGLIFVVVNRSWRSGQGKDEKGQVGMPMALFYFVGALVFFLGA